MIQPITEVLYGTLKKDLGKLSRTGKKTQQQL